MNMKILTIALLTSIFPALAYCCDGDSQVSTAVSSNRVSDADENASATDQAVTAAPGEKVEDVPNNPKYRALMGKLLGTKEVAIQGYEAKHVLAKIETPSGHIVIADLGLREDLKDARLIEGEQLEIYGVVGRLNERPLLVAESIGEVINIKRTSNVVPIKAGFEQRDELNRKDTEAKPGMKINENAKKAELTNDAEVKADEPKLIEKK